jgi:arylsulfatase A-like enzyme
MLRWLPVFLSLCGVLGDQYDVVFSGNCGQASDCQCPPAGLFPSTRPNFMFITVDQERYNPGYVDQSILDIVNNFPGRKTIRSKSVYFTQHHIASAACSPSRATFYTGHYPSLHGVAQTDGVGKSAEDPGIHWLGEGAVPTLGHYLNAAGYNIQYRGKWHVAHRDIAIPGTQTSILSLNSDGTPNTVAEGIYQAANLLHRFGFEGWIGNEPHGSSPVNTGILRDPAYTVQIMKAISDLENSNDKRPFWLTCSFVNPHDISVYPGLNTFQVIQNDTFSIPTPSKPPTDNMTTKPIAQSSFSGVWDNLIRTGKYQHGDDYRRAYYYFQRYVDIEINKVVNRMATSRFYNNTYIIFTADHGELLQSHGGMLQKWAQAYEEALHIELIFHHSSLTGQTNTSNQLITSHIDLIPTFLGLAGVDCYNREIIRRELKAWNTEALPLLGNDLSDVIRKGGVGGTVFTCRDGNDMMVPLPTVAYFMTDDDISRGDIQRAANVTPIVQPNSVEAVITFINGTQWKYVFYHDHTKIPTTTTDSPMQIAALQAMGRFNTSVSDFELYNLTDDPYELNNYMYGVRFCNQTATPTVQSVCMALDSLLYSQRSMKRLVPLTQNNPRCPRLVC